MKITVLSENHSLDPALEAEYGLSVLVERAGASVLFDTGSYGACLDNAEKLGKDLGALSAIAFSHNHRDHCGGFLRLARELHPSCPVYAHTGFFRRKLWDHRCDPPEQATYGQTLELVGPVFGPEFLYRERIEGFRLLADDVFSLGCGMYLLGGFPTQRGIEAVHPSSVMEAADGSLTADDFSEEQALAVETDGGLALLTGCAHNGIMNIINTARRRFPEKELVGVFGGMHLVPPEPARIDRTAEFLRESGISVVGACHCTGEAGLCALAERVPAYRETGAGFTWESAD